MMEPFYDEEYVLLCEDDYHLVQKYLLGDSDAENILYRRAYRPAMRRAKQANSDGLFSYEDLQDIVSEALFRCFYKCEQYAPITRFSTWACGFVHFTALEARRKHYLTKQMETDFTYYCAGIETINPETYVILKEREFCFWLAFDSLSDIQRHLVLWDAFGVYTQTETRKITGLRRSEMKIEAQRAERILHRRHMVAYYGSNSFHDLGILDVTTEKRGRNSTFQTIQNI